MKIISKVFLKSFLMFCIALFALSATSSLTFNWICFGEIPGYQPFELDSTVKEIDTRSAFILHKKQQAVFVDARNREDYDRVHIEGAVSLPYRSPREVKYEIAENFPENVVLIVYCKDASCELAERLAGQLNFMGYNRVIIYRDGLEDWQARGNPLVRGQADE